MANDPPYDAPEKSVDRPRDPKGAPSGPQSPEEKPKRRRRSAKIITEKKFECKHPGCGRQYSRAEHLYRHQLNHNPKQIFRCDYPDCYREFVRQDLCIRHRERHTTHGSQLQRRDNFSQGVNGLAPLVAAPAKADYGASNRHSLSFSPTESTTSPDESRHDFGESSPVSIKRSFSDGHQSLPGLVDSNLARSGDSVDARFQPPTPQIAPKQSDRFVKRSESSSSYGKSPAQKTTHSAYHHASRHSSFSAVDATNFQPISESPTESYKPGQLRTHSGSSVPQSTHSYAFTSSTSDATNYVLPHSYQPTSASQHPLSSPEVAASSASFVAAISQGLSRFSTFDASGSDVPSSLVHPIFGGDEIHRSPFSMNDDFTAWLFNEGRNYSSRHFPPTTTGLVPVYNDRGAMQQQAPFYPQDQIFAYSDLVPQQHPMDLQTILDSKPPIFCMCEEKRQELLYLMSETFSERPHDAVRKRKQAIFEGDINADDHILSLKRMHLYVGSYWYHQHAQMPILHKPTFSADKTPNLLLLIILAIGAATLDKIHGTSLTDAAAEFANFVAWHLRWELQRDADFRPPAKLWVFQALLLLEIYEKMYATRQLHERAHIHHDTTLTLMRRGSSLVGRSAYDSPPSVREGRENKPSTASSAMDVPSTDESWNQWIRNEATRRVAFAAFVIDSTHATMFGHSAKMVAHEMRLPLPCDEALWSATSAAEVARVNASLQNNGVKPILFLDGLKKTLNGQRVMTNSFGRTILMAGLLSVSWHMNQRDLQITSLGSHNFGGRDKWRHALLRAFDNWKRDFDEALADNPPSTGIPTTSTERFLNSHLPRYRAVDDENIFESRTVLHHLAHMASHADIVECQIYAGATRILGRSIAPKDYASVRDKVEQWAHRASARDAAFYALKFLAQVLIPPDNETARVGTGPPNIILSLAVDDQNLYFARDDYLMNRPWVLYFATLVVWCYGFALEGPITPSPSDEVLSTSEARNADMRDYLERVGGVVAPDDLVEVKGKNRCLGMLMILRESFIGTRWELTHEAANLLGSCIQKLQGKVTAQHGVDLKSGNMSWRDVSSTPSTTTTTTTNITSTTTTSSNYPANASSGPGAATGSGTTRTGSSTSASI